MAVLLSGGDAKTMSLNSQRLTAPILRSVAASLEIPMSVSSEELRQMIDRKLIKERRKPRDVQLVIVTAQAEAAGVSERVLLQLQDGDGVLFEVEPREDAGSLKGSKGSGPLGSDPEPLAEVGDESEGSRTKAWIDHTTDLVWRSGEVSRGSGSLKVFWRGRRIGLQV